MCVLCAVFWLSVSLNLTPSPSPMHKVAPGEEVISVAEIVSLSAHF